METVICNLETCFNFASKILQYDWQVQTLCYLTDNTYDKNQVLKMERQILRTIEFDLNIVDVTVFMDKILLIESDLPKEVGVKIFVYKNIH